MIHPAYAQQVVVTETVRRVLDLRETLVRMDENLKAYWLLKQTPHFAVDHPAIVHALDDQYEMVKHVLPRDELREADRDADPYAAYYATNVHELRFENQYGLPIEEVHRLPRVQMLLDGLADDSVCGALRVLDLGCNDGFMAARLALDGYRCDGLDLHPGNIEIARERKADYSLMGRFEVGAAEDAPRIVADKASTLDHPLDPEVLLDRDGFPMLKRRRYDAVVAYEVVEHVRDPRALLDAMVACCKPGGALYLSTPNGTVEGGNLPTWAHVEPKGHVRVYRPQDFRALLETVGTVDRFELGNDGVLCARVRPA